MAKGWTMNKAIAKATNSTGSSRSETVPFQARPAWRSRFCRRAAVCARRRGPPRIRGVPAGVRSARRGRWGRSESRDSCGIPDSPHPALILQVPAPTVSSTLSQDTLGSFTHRASHNIKHKDRHHGSLPWLLQLKGDGQMGKDREKGFLFIPTD